MKKTEVEQELVKDLKDLTRAVKGLRDLELLQVIKNPGKMMWLALLKGLMIGFGSVIGATVLVAVFIYLIAQIKVVPIVGNFVEKVIEEVQVAQPTK